MFRGSVNPTIICILVRFRSPILENTEPETQPKTFLFKFKFPPTPFSWMATLANRQNTFACTRCRHCRTCSHDFLQHTAALHCKTRKHTATHGNRDTQQRSRNRTHTRMEICWSVRIGLFALHIHIRVEHRAQVAPRDCAKPHPRVLCNPRNCQQDDPSYKSLKSSSAYYDSSNGIFDPTHFFGRKRSKICIGRIGFFLSILVWEHQEHQYVVANAVMRG